MIPTSSTYKTKVLADTRRFVPLVRVYFDGDSAAPTEFTETGIASISLLEESQADSDKPLGAVSANELTIAFDNSARDFTPTNTSGAYYGKMRPNVLVRAYLGLEISTGTYEYIPLGEFRTGDWSAPAGSVEATVTCYDKLYELGQKDVPMLPVQATTTIYELFETLFKALGLTQGQYEIDPSLNQSISLGWLPKGKVKDALQKLAEAGNCNVTANRFGIIRVRNNFRSGSADTTWTDENVVNAAENPQKYLNAYNKVQVNYKLPYLKASASLLKVDNLTVPQGGITLEGLEFSSGPVAGIDQVRLIGAVNAAISSVEFGAWTCTIVLANAGAAETVILEVIGRQVDTVNASYTAADDVNVATWGEKKLTIDNELIQDQNVAREYAGALLQFVNDPLAWFTIDARGDPAVEVGDIVEIQDPSDKVGTVDVVPIRISYDYDGGLGNVQIEARKPIVPYDWVYVSPGLWEYVPREISTYAAEVYAFVGPGMLSR